MKLSYLRGVLLASGALGASGMVAGAEAQQREDYVLPELVVTSTKLDATGLTPDVASSVATAARLNAAGVVRTDELGKIFPELTVMPRSTRVYSLFSMRGAPAIDFYNPAVTVYVDGIPQDMTYFAQPLTGVAQIELLKGPQGSLYGRSAQGGVINIVTSKPNNTSKAQMTLDVSNMTRRLDVMASGALVKDSLYGDINVYADEYPGRLRAATGADDLGSSREALGRARLRWAPMGGNLDAMLTVSRDRYSAHDEYFQSFPLKYRRAIASTPFDFAEPALTRTVSQVGLGVDYFMNDWKLTSSSSYQDRKFERVITTGNSDPENQKTYYQELRLATSGGKRAVDGVFGLYYEKQDFERLRGVAVPTVPAFLFPGPSKSASTITSTAIFGEAVWHLDERLDLTGGLRYSVDKADIDYKRTGAAALSFAADKRFSHVSPKLALGYQLTPEWRVYGLVSEGYKAGGYNRVAENTAGGIPYDAETIRNLEAGFKADLMGHRLQLDGTVFHSKTRDLQAPVQSGPFQMLANVGDAKANGLEINAAFAATQDFSLRGGASWTHSTIENFHAPAGNIDLNGKRVPYVVPLSLRAGTELRFQMAGAGLLRWNTSLTYSGDLWFDTANTLSQPTYTLLDTSIQWEVSKRLSLTAYVDNVGDRIVPNYAFSFGPLGDFGQYNRGRTVGLRLQAQL
ncbi:TonB-dependent receptor [Undibacterium sp. CY18W]|uniref:TonB-dependent receptor n=1 Tax=Undibacterium hunanense TaxID=2762292 RepID=A0ABR6ZMP2_9BURK|nr:TonB-dependent receptor [Undibacterium hunanense]MBC3917142.1 TonB-dependent receptor [Undibacterium hunanense]